MSVDLTHPSAICLRCERLGPVGKRGWCGLCTEDAIRLLGYDPLTDTFSHAIADRQVTAFQATRTGVTAPTGADTREQDAVPMPQPGVRTGTTKAGYRVMYPAPGTTLNQARDWLREKYTDHGALCPCCKQVAREYRRTIHAAMAQKLIQFWRTYGTMTWGERTPLMLRGRAGAADGGGDFAKLRYWGLVEEADEERQDGGRAGWWRVTQVGAEFVQNRRGVPRYAYVYDGQLRRVDGALWNIERCLGKRFHYNELMGYAI